MADGVVVGAVDPSSHNRSIPVPVGSRGIDIGGGASKSSQPNSQVYGSSWTEQHMVQQAFLRDVIERTQVSFIDVSQEPTILDDKDAEERMSRYELDMKDAKGDTAASQCLTRVLDTPLEYTVSSNPSENTLSSAIESYTRVDMSVVPDLVVSVSQF